MHSTLPPHAKPFLPPVGFTDFSINFQPHRWRSYKRATIYGLAVIGPFAFVFVPQAIRYPTGGNLFGAALMLFIFWSLWKTHSFLKQALMRYDERDALIGIGEKGIWLSNFPSNNLQYHQALAWERIEAVGLAVRLVPRGGIVYFLYLRTVPSLKLAWKSTEPRQKFFDCLISFSSWIERAVIKLWPGSQPFFAWVASWNNPESMIRDREIAIRLYNKKELLRIQMPSVSIAPLESIPHSTRPMPPSACAAPSPINSRNNYM